jgi:hypothetical protein
MPIDKAVAILRDGRGRQWDPCAGYLAYLWEEPGNRPLCGTSICMMQAAKDRRRLHP